VAWHRRQRAGKTTTLRAISGMIRPRHGRVMFGGHDVTGSPAERISRLGLVHIPEGRRALSAAERRGHASSRFEQHGTRGRPGAGVPAFPALRERRRQAVGTLSGGEQQMVALARAILARPRLVMVDEMSQGLAPTVVQQLFEILRVFREQGIAVLAGRAVRGVGAQRR